MFEEIIYFLVLHFIGVFRKNENSIFLKKNGHFSLKKEKRKKKTIFMKKNAIFIFKKTPIKRMTKKKKNYCFRHFFLFFYFVFF